jgi:drug/metabolite transporter (DMT)-like permease
MMFLVLSIFLSVLTVCFFKLFERFGVQTFQAILFNYVTCIVVGNLSAETPVILKSFWTEPWFPYAAVLGFMFISVFYSIGLVSQKMGVSVSMVAAKLSVVIPVTIAVLLHGDQLSIAKIGGILISLLAVYLITVKPEQPQQSAGSWMWLLPVYIFVGSGIIDSMLKYMQARFIPPSNAGDMISTVFLCACCIGLVVLVYKRETIQLKSVLWGIGLGIPNYYCMYFLVKTLQEFDASFIFPINNIAIVVCSTLISMSFFKERLSRQNWIGFGLAIVSILIISFT